MLIQIIGIRILLRMMSVSIVLFLLCATAYPIEIDVNPSWNNKDPDWTSKLQLADVNNDGYVDLITANFIRGAGYTRNNTATIKIYKNIRGHFEGKPGQIIKMKDNTGSWNIALGDYDNDGDLDLAAGNIFEKKDLVFRNHQGTFEDEPIWKSGDSSVTHGLDWVDYDQDGTLDLSTSAAYSGAKIYKNANGSLSRHAIWESYEALDYQDVDWADMDNDGDFDLAVANHNERPPGGVFVYKMNEGEMPQYGSWIPNKIKKYLPLLGSSLIKTVSWKTLAVKTPGRLAWGDIDGDGFPELAVTNASGPAMVFKNVEGSLQEEPLWESADHENSFDLIFADMDNDGLVQNRLTLTGAEIENVIYLPHSPVHAVSEIYIDSQKLSKRSYCYNLKDGWISFDLEELESAQQLRVEYTYSTDIDLVVAKSTWEGSPKDGKHDRIYLNEGGRLNKQADWSTEKKTLSTAVAVGDVDNDGDLDIVFGGEVGSVGKTKVPQHIYLYLNRTVE